VGKGFPGSGYIFTEQLLNIHSTHFLKILAGHSQDAKLNSSKFLHMHLHDPKSTKCDLCILLLPNNLKGNNLHSLTDYRVYVKGVEVEIFFLLFQRNIISVECGGCKPFDL